MKITAIRETTVPVGSAMRNASIAFDGMTASALAIVTDRVIDGKPVIGYAFDSIGRYANGGLLRERFIPRLLAAAPAALLDGEGVLDPGRCREILMANEKAGGHGERSGAVGLLDAALWDARAKVRGVPLWQLLADQYATANASSVIRTYASCGHFSTAGGAHDLAHEIKGALDLGYTLVKIKVDGGDAGADAARIATALAVLPGPGDLAIDANGHADADDAGWVRMVAAHALAWVEEPAAPLDYAGLARFARIPGVAIGTGENLFSFDDARNLLRHGGLDAARDRIQIDMLLAYGLPEYLRILDLFTAHGWRRGAFWPHAGHLFAAHVVAGLGLGCHESAPDATRLYGGFWDGTRVEDGTVRIPDLPGAGFEAKSNLYAVLRALA